MTSGEGLAADLTKTAVSTSTLLFVVAPGAPVTKPGPHSFQVLVEISAQRIVKVNLMLPALIDEYAVRHARMIVLLHKQTIRSQLEHMAAMRLPCLAALDLHGYHLPPVPHNIVRLSCDSVP